MLERIGKGRVYRIAFDPAYQSLALAEPSLLTTPEFHFDSTSKANVWKPVDLVSTETHKLEPDFWRVEGVTAGFVCNRKVLKGMPVLWAGKVCEPLPVCYGSRSLWLANVTQHGCWDALDVTRCVWPSGVPGVGIPSHYEFFNERLGFTTVLTVPETCERELYVYEYSGDPASEFKGGVERAKLAGLVFEEIWNSTS